MAAGPYRMHPKLFPASGIPGQYHLEYAPVLVEVTGHITIAPPAYRYVKHKRGGTSLIPWRPTILDPGCNLQSTRFELLV
jgi:hypothetical protein